jgi:hypothetical protein
MAQPSDLVLDGFILRSGAKIVRYPDRYSDERGTAMWDRVIRLLDAEGNERGCHSGVIRRPGNQAPWHNVRTKDFK